QRRCCRAWPRRSRRDQRHRRRRTYRRGDGAADRHSSRLTRPLRVVDPDDARRGREVPTRPRRGPGRTVSRHRHPSATVLASIKMDRSEWPGRVFRNGERPPDDDVVAGTVAERLAMMWPLAIDAWAMRGEGVAESRFRRDAARVI